MVLLTGRRAGARNSVKPSPIYLFIPCARGMRSRRTHEASYSPFSLVGTKLTTNVQLRRMQLFRLKR